MSSPISAVGSIAQQMRTVKGWIKLATLIHAEADATNQLLRGSGEQLHRALRLNCRTVTQELVKQTEVNLGCVLATGLALTLRQRRVRQAIRELEHAARTQAFTDSQRILILATASDVIQTELAAETLIELQARRCALLATGPCERSTAACTHQKEVHRVRQSITAVVTDALALSIHLDNGGGRASNSRLAAGSVTTAIQSSPVESHTHIVASPHAPSPVRPRS